MAKSDSGKCVFPLTSLQIGDLQSYLSDLKLFLANESKRLYILVDNRPWSRDLGPAHLWQLVLTKSRSSPFAPSKARKGKKLGENASSKADTGSTELKKWFSLIDATTLSHKRGLLAVEKLRNSLLQSSELHRILYGFIVFEVSWESVRGINYLNELQTDTSLAMEAKLMKRWEFGSIAQAASCLHSWFSGTPAEQQLLREYLDSILGEVFFDAEENFSRDMPIDDNGDEITLSADDYSPHHICNNFSVYTRTAADETGEHTPPPTGPYKRRKVTRCIESEFDSDTYPEERQHRAEGSVTVSEAATCCSASAIESMEYRDVLILFRFNDRDLPFKLREIIVSDLRLLTLLEAGLPSWVIFLQSYPGFCHIYRPWMCPLARALYVLISLVTVLIGFYDLYKNVPLLKATASRLCGPLFDWIETWDMVSRIKCLGTMLFLHNIQKAVKWFLAVTHTTRTFFTMLTQPLAMPFMQFLELFVPLWDVCTHVVENLFSVACIMMETTGSFFGDVFEVLFMPFWYIFSFIWTMVTSILYPVFCIIWEVFYAPIRMVLALGNFVALMWTSVSDLFIDIWLSVSGIFRLASASEATVSTSEVSVWRSLWNDLFSQVFRAVKSILYGFVAFFSACNRHRLSIYNHILEFIERARRSSRAQSCRSRCTDPRQNRCHFPSEFEVIKKVHAE